MVHHVVVPVVVQLRILRAESGRRDCADGPDVRVAPELYGLALILVHLVCRQRRRRAVQRRAVRVRGVRGTGRPSVQHPRIVVWGGCSVDGKVALADGD